MSDDNFEFGKMTAERVRSAELGEFLPSTDDVAVFWESLRLTAEYKEAICRRMEAAKKSPYYLRNPVSEVEVVEAFEGTEEFKSMFWDFNEDCLHLAYNPEKLPQEFRAKFEEYKQSVYASLRSIEEGKNIETMRAKDMARSEAHNKVAQVLVSSGLVSTEFLGRMTVRAFLVDSGMDYISSARQADLLRRLRDAQDTKTIARALSDGISSRRVKVFAPERAIAIREKFSSFGIVRRADYLNPKPTSSFVNLLPPQGDQENVRIPHVDMPATSSEAGGSVSRLVHSRKHYPGD